MYHRVHTPQTDPWDLSVDPAHFEEQIKFISTNYTIVSTGELMQQLQNGKIEHKSIALTFDDGYIDNFENARPVLETYSVPATFFITDSYLTENRPFWWDELENIIVHTDQLPGHLTLTHHGETISFNLGDESLLGPTLREKHKFYRAYNPPTKRTRLYVKLWKVFSLSTKEEQEELLTTLRQWAGTSSEGSEIEGCMDLDELKILAKDPLFTIGGHTKTHPFLSTIPEERQRYEITENRQVLEGATNTPIDQFAYPSGNFDDSTQKILKEEHFLGAFTTNNGCVFTYTDPFAIPRLHVKNWSARDFKTNLNNWFKKW